MVFRRNGEGNHSSPTEYKGGTTDNLQPMRENYQNTIKAEGESGRFCCDTSKINPNNPSPLPLPLPQSPSLIS